MDELVRGAMAVSMFVRLKSGMASRLSLPIRSSEMGLVILVAKSDHPVTAVEVARFLQVSKPMVATMIKSMIKKGYLLKEQDQADRRKFYLKTTDKAEQLVAEAFEEYHRTMGILLDKMGADDYHSFIQLMERANEVLMNEKMNG